MDFRKAQQKLDAYAERISGLPHRPLSITLHMASPFSVIGFLFGDGILSYLAARDVLGSELDNLPDDKSTLLNVPLPLRQYGKDKKVWCCSIGFYEPKHTEGVSSWKKQFDTKHDGLIDFGNKEQNRQRKPKIKNQMGFFKAYDMPLVYVNSPRVTFYACGNKDELKRLLKGLRFIGKKRSQGYGQIRCVEIEAADQDLSVFCGDEVTRPVPSSEITDAKITKANQQPYMAYRPPYWHAQNFTECLCPKEPILKHRGEPKT